MEWVHFSLVARCNLTPQPPLQTGEGEKSSAGGRHAVRKVRCSPHQCYGEGAGVRLARATNVKSSLMESLDGALCKPVIFSKHAIGGAALQHAENNPLPNSVSKHNMKGVDL